MIDYSLLREEDPTIGEALTNELNRQQHGLELIPSENFVSEAVMQALGSIATNKYSEGYPGKRYYGGMEFVDIIEQTAIDRAKELFGAEHANVQPLSGGPMNIAVYFALLQPGDTVLGMDLGHGGHLTHGHPVTTMAKLYNFVRYACNPDTGEIDFEELRRLAHEHKPKIVLAGFSAYSRELDYAKFHEIAQEVGAVSMMDMAHIGGLVAGGAAKNPVPIMDIVTTTTHKSLRGPRGGLILCKAEFAKVIDKSVFPGFQGGPHENQIAALAVALKEAAAPEFKIYSTQIVKNAKALCAALQSGGMRILFGGTDNHLILADVTPLGLTGHEAETLLDSVGITVNKNMIPRDPRKPMDPSGIRMGTPALTTRGMGELEMTRIGEMMVRLLKSTADLTVQEEARVMVKELTEEFPLYS
ncbi:MAG: serine hydroxymethyltransferase [Candidatus Kerfeldbacteria bacterium CG15_BIG_FIL_POST_REV_8_21_14_020_45_12]|uniref:Serine hydroxymethyltransferase n=1 Tax=Candidatus Kerfeldbacteria bacterium CG15_BIG_FIL_POST_REV_8_21_14_020_45_12 TaxID=2014247 RepID=A0A2M7H5C0_9BACT|nr:MAG: serine hydroxymethyltransferase [Candidatus Kerfeldbacteria bacterium CG15_BIG_FIL_POST_REV_8_21_14_020_45_12]PJA93510.1 MAG: serine hydroxymethyltransferase [Candidatus Kerfeldbacteria bacterium CG_4_9_14_3_um_filter_45_8]